MPATPNSPRPPKRASGTCRWVHRGCGLLRINFTDYTVVRLRGGYRLLNRASGTVYDIGATGRSCSCPSFVWDHCPVQAGGDGRCKHIAALRALGLLPDPERLDRSA